MTIMPSAAVFIITTCLILLAALVITGRHEKLDERLKGLTRSKRSRVDSERVAEATQATLTKMGEPLLPSDEIERSRLRTRLIHAGFYSPRAIFAFLGVKMLLMTLPGLAGLAGGILGFFPVGNGIKYGIIASVVGMIIPGVALDYCKRRRQASLRRSLPDALDVIVICMEGGLSLMAAFHRVVSELRMAHPLLAAEMSIVEREIQLGRTMGDALRHFADRTNMEELRTMASVIIQAEHYGASLVSTLRTHARTLRMMRVLRAEEKAQKAAVKIVFPTLLCIFPAVFIVLAGPAAIQVMDMRAKMKP
jgi:tight adherence protein C